MQPDLGFLAHASPTFPIIKLVLEDLAHVAQLEAPLSIDVDQVESFPNFRLVYPSLVSGDSLHEGVESQVIILVSLHKLKHAFPLALVEANLELVVIDTLQNVILRHEATA